MPKRELIVRLEDVRLRIERIGKLMQTVTSFEALQSDVLYQDALERNFEIIGEAMYQIRKIRPDIPITNKDQIIGMRHIIAHDYYKVNPRQLWETVVNHLPLLQEEIGRLIDEENQRLFGTSAPELDL